MKSLMLILCLLLPSLAMAHEEPENFYIPAQAAVNGAVKDAMSAVTVGAKTVETGVRVAPRLDWLRLIREAARSHRHNKIVHFPVALGLVGAIFLLLSGKFEGLRSAARWMLFLAALGSIAAIISGRAQAGEVESEAMRQVLQVHAALGYDICAGLWLTWLLSFVDSAKRWIWVLLLLLIAAILLAGTLGGALAHMQF